MKPAIMFSRNSIYAALGTVLLHAPLTAAWAQGSAMRLSETNIDAVVSAMTLDEKLSLVVGIDGLDESSLTAAVGSTARLLPGAAGQTVAIERLGIPAIVLADGPA